MSGLVGSEIVVSEKCDGSNLAYTRTHVFSRSHSGPPTHPSFAIAKATHAQLAHELPDELSIFCEYCYAVHSIEYEALPGFSLVFGIRDDAKGTWWSWDEVAAQAAALSLPTVPVLFRGVVKNERALRALTESLSAAPSDFGGRREGVVVRRAEGFDDAAFPRSLGKWVRKDHVTTDEHWMHQSIRPQRLR